MAITTALANKGGSGGGQSSLEYHAEEYSAKRKNILKQILVLLGAPALRILLPVGCGTEKREIDTADQILPSLGVFIGNF